MITPDTLAARLRAETATAHRQLEAEMDFDLGQPRVEGALAMLQGFYRVLPGLEPVMLAAVPADVAAGRAKVAMLHGDLKTLGMSEVDIRSIGAPAVSWLPGSAAQALGALYVLEGSTLGGKLIVKALLRLADWPIAGKCYFDPYGDETGAMWKSFQRYLESVPSGDGDEIVDAADKTFALLHECMVSRKAR